MKQFRFTGALFCAAIVFLFTSCGGGTNEKTTATDSAAAADSAAKADAAAKAASTIVTTPQNMVVVTHKVANYAKWLSSYEAHDSARLAAGMHDYVVGRGVKDSNMVLVAIRIDDTAKAKAFMKDPGLKKAMEKGGVVGKPMVSITTSVWQDTAHIDPNTIRAMTSITVKDWDAWYKSFEDGKQFRLDNGIADRVVGHDINDNKKVNVVTALSDTAKASVYYKSDELKKRMAAGGVVGEPVRFFFTITKRY